MVILQFITFTSNFNDVQHQSFSKIRKNLLSFNLRKNNRPLIFFVCLIISSTLWLINSLGKEYETFVSIPVVYTNLPKNKVFIKDPPKSFQVKMTANGFVLLKHKFNLSYTPINIDLQDFSRNIADHNSKHEFLFFPDRYLSQISKQFGSDISILDISPDTLRFQFDGAVETKKQIVSNLILEFENQYFLKDSIAFTPKFVTVRGPKAIVDSINFIRTEQLKLKNLNTDIQQTIYLEKIEGLIVEPDKVLVNIPVSQYTEYIAEIPIRKINVPDNINLITYPGTVEVNCLVSITDYKNIVASSFTIGVDYNDIKVGDKYISLKIMNSPSSTKKIKIQPTQVEYIIEK